jgi:hypothetical protein
MREKRDDASYTVGRIKSRSYLLEKVETWVNGTREYFYCFKDKRDGMWFSIEGQDLRRFARWLLKR